MEDTKGLIDKIKEMVFSEDKDVTPTEEVSFADVKTADGVILRVEGELAVGSEVKIISEEGEEVSKEAEYVLEDGKTIKVDAEGKVSEVIEAKEDEAKEDPKEGDVVEAELAEEDPKEEEEEEKKEEEVDPLEARVAELEKMIESLMSQFSEVSTQVQEFSALPADEEIKVKKVELSSVASKKKTGLEALANYRNK